MAYGTNTPAFAATILKWITGCKLIVEIPGVPEDAFRYEAPTDGALKRFFADRLLYFCGHACDCFKLLYPWQLQKYPSLKRKAFAVFHDFVPISCIRLPTAVDKYILCIGHPWYRKGLDVLIRAFKSIAHNYPNYRLKLMGYYPDRHNLDQLAEGCKQIEFLVAQPNELALELISSCSIYVLASRSEAMGRVLLEAMAAARPIVASNVGGVAYYIANCENGLLVESENIDELSAAMVRLIEDPHLQTTLGESGHRRVYAEFDEKAYVRNFQAMLKSIGL